MLRKLRPRSAYDLMAAIAFFIAVAGGTAYAAATITGDDVVNESLTGSDIQGKNGTATKAGVNGSIRTEDVYGQPSIPGIQPSINGGLTGNDIADRSLAARDLAAAQAWQNIQTPTSASQCPFTDGFFVCINSGTAVPQWRNDSSSANNDAAYYKDPLGVVHLKGIVCFTDPAVNCGPGSISGTPPTILQLPPGYRPAREWSFHTETRSGEALIEIGANGRVQAVNGNYQGVALDGIDFRACGEPGSEACPPSGPS